MQCHINNTYINMVRYGLTFGHEQVGRWLLTSHIAVGAQVPEAHAEVHLYCWHI
jgi:hypothetical protein